MVQNEKCPHCGKLPHPITDEEVVRLQTELRLESHPEVNEEPDLIVEELRKTKCLEGGLVP
jgi:hypothetical protein